MKNKQQIPYNYLDDLLKKSVLTEPSDDLEEKVIKKIHEDAIHAASPGISKWILTFVYAILGIIFVVLLFVPLDIKLPFHINRIFDLSEIQLNLADVFGLMPSQSYLVAASILFAAAVWLVIYFNIPKKDRIRKFI